jgi:uncharacterized tellurite resistance protein B-like protein
MHAILLKFLLLVLFQAGGGGDFGSSGGSDFGGGGFGGSDTSDFTSGDYSGGGRSRPLTTAEVVFWCLVVAAILAYKLYEAWNTAAPQAITRDVRVGLKRQQKAIRERFLQDIRQADPQFSEQQFLDRCSQAFAQIQKCWALHNLGECRALLSDAVFERFQLYLKMQQAAEIHHRIDHLDISESRIVAVSTDAPFDTIHVQFTASALIREEPLTKMHQTAWQVPRKTFSEVWTFVRRRGVQTSQQRSLLVGQCPHCGAQLQLVDGYQCSHCQSHVHAGFDDWVLCEITQDTEWIVAESTADIPGWHELQQRDPALSLPQLEDRASIVFWRSLLSLYFKDPQIALPVLPAHNPSIPASWLVTNDGFWQRPAVGSVQLLRCEPGNSDGEFDRAVILIRWSGTRACGNRVQPHVLSRQMVYPHELTLIRKRGAQSKLENTFHSFSCRACGAPIDVRGAASCRWCSQSLNDGSYDWVLESVAPHDLWRPMSSRRVSPQPATMPAADVDPDNVPPALPIWHSVNAWQQTTLPPDQILACTAAMILADGRTTEAESQLLSHLATQFGMTEEQRQQAVSMAETALQQPPSPDQLQVFLHDLIRVAFVDGTVTREERAILKRLSAPLNWTTAQLNREIQNVRNSIVRQSRSTTPKQGS